MSENKENDDIGKTTPNNAQNGRRVDSNQAIMDLLISLTVNTTIDPMPDTAADDVADTTSDDVTDVNADIPNTDTIPPDTVQILAPTGDLFDKNGFVTPTCIPCLVLVNPHEETAALEWVIDVANTSPQYVKFVADAIRKWKFIDGDNIYHVFDYSGSIYNNSTLPVSIRCVRHDITFLQTPNNHIRGNEGCAACRFDPILQIRHCHEYHNMDPARNPIFPKPRYQYYLCPGTLTKAKDKIVMNCTIHPEVRPFGVTLDSHRRGASGCKRCNSATRSASNIARSVNVRGVSLLSEFPEIAAELVNVEGQPKADQLAPFSNKKVIWRCGRTENPHPNYQKSVDKRTKNGQGCPYCSGSIASPENNFSLVPQASEWWDYEKNTVRPENILKNVKKQKFWFLCDCTDRDGYPLRHSYMAHPNNFTYNERCPYKAGKRVDDSNSFALICPTMSSFWDMSANNGLSPNDVTYGSGRPCRFKCTSCGNCWTSTPNIVSRQFGASGYCVQCAANGYQSALSEWVATRRLPNKMDVAEANYTVPETPQRVVREKPPRTPNQSGVALDWLSTVGDNVVHAGNAGEYHIPNTPYYADGYDPETNTIFEFHGTFWHGHPDFFPRDKKHPCCDKTFGELYDATLERERRILELGYNLVVVWEHEWRAMKRLDGTWSVPADK